MKTNIVSVAYGHVRRAEEMGHRAWLHRVGLIGRWREEWKDRAEGASLKARARALEVMSEEAIG